MSDEHSEKRKARLRRHHRVRRKVCGTSDRPRLSVFRSLKHIYAQIIDDDAGRTIVAASSLKLGKASAGEVTGGESGGGESIKMHRSREVGKAIAEAAMEKGIKRVTFDRGGYLYHGRVAALAKAAREFGLEV